MKKPFSKIAAFIFLLVALLHVVRLVKGAQLMIGSHDVPMWVSIVGIILPAILSWGIWKESGK
jgi:Mn2+/Fe2+ NRAMP family transporter